MMTLQGPHRVVRRGRPVQMGDEDAGSAAARLLCSAQTRLQPASRAVATMLFPEVHRATIPLRMVRSAGRGFFPSVWLVRCPSAAACGNVEIIPRHLQCEIQQHFLHGLKDDFRNAVGFCGDVGEIHDAGHGKPRPLARPSRPVSASSSGGRHHDLARLKIPQQLRADRRALPSPSRDRRRAM